VRARQRLVAGVTITVHILRRAESVNVDGILFSDKSSGLGRNSMTVGSSDWNSFSGQGKRVRIFNVVLKHYFACVITGESLTVC
jgi:hypothetical protein